MGGTVRNQQGMKGARRFVMLQFFLALLLAGIFLLLSGSKAAISALLGGAVTIIPNALFAKKLFKHQGARSAKKIVSSFYKGEALKIILSIILFVIVFKYISVLPHVFFTVYIAVQMMFWFAPLIF